MKKCNTCNETKSLDDFSWKIKSKGIKSSKCKSCQKAYAAEHYKNNSDDYKTRAKRARPVARQSGREFVLEYLRDHPCVDCGNADIRVLQFDHREMVGSKAPRISSLIHAPNVLKAEIAKCDVRCANCHMIRTFEQMGWIQRLAV